MLSRRDTILKLTVRAGKDAERQRDKALKGREEKYFLEKRKKYTATHADTDINIHT